MEMENMMNNPLAPIIAADQSNTFDPALAATTAGFSTLMVHTTPDQHGRDRSKTPYNFRRVTALGYDGTAAGGFNSATRDASEMFRWLTWADTRPGGRKPLNTGLAVGQLLPDGTSGTLAVVDLDTAAAVEAWEALAAEHGETAPPMTVLSPGKRAADGTWIHRGGGHVYIRVPQHALPTLRLRATEVLGTAGTAADGIDVKLKDSLVLMPPSSRAEGAYTWAPGATITDAPEWLLDELRSRERSHTVKTRPVASAEPSEALERWEDEDAVAWETLLTAAGYTDAGEEDSCGCPIWTRPGAASVKSAVAHEAGCGSGLWDGSGTPPLHLFTTGDQDTPIGLMAEAMGRQTLTRVEVAAAVYAEPSEAGLKRFWRRSGLAAAVEKERNMVRFGVENPLDLQARVRAMGVGA